MQVTIFRVLPHLPGSNFPFLVRQYINGKRTTRLKAFGFPLVAKLPSAFNGSDIQAIYKKLLSPFQVPAPDALEENHTSDVDAIEKTREVENGTNSGSACAIDPLRSEDADNSPSDADLQFYTTDEKGFVRGSEIQVGEFVVGSEKSKRLYVLVSWPEKQIERYDTRLLTSLPEVFKSSYLTKRPQESVSLYKCLEAFLQEEPLGPEDMWSVHLYFCFLLLKKLNVHNELCNSDLVVWNLEIETL